MRFFEFFFMKLLKVFSWNFSFYFFWEFLRLFWIFSWNYCLITYFFIFRRVDVVRLGATHLDVTPVSSQDLSVASWTVHPDYQSHQSYHDIAILRLATSVSLSRGVRPICLADGRQGRRDGEVTLVMGWGAQQLGKFRKSFIFIFYQASVILKWLILENEWKAKKWI